MEAYKKEFIEFMVESHVLKFGEFTLKSGRKSPFFMNAGAYVTGGQLKRLGEYYARAIHDNFGLDFDMVFGPAYKGIPLAVVTAIALKELYGKEVKYCCNRKEVKDHGADAGNLLGAELHDGDRVKPGDVAFYVSGRLRSLLQAERIILNIMQRMSGVATQTAVYVARLEGLHTKVLDTRKTTPGMRVLDKMAVKIGGGENHRMGLFDMILLKDNHIDFAGGIRKAICGAREYLKAKGKDIPIECEVRSLEDIDEVFAAGGADRIMFDNFTPAMTREAVKKVAGRCETESSGGITLDTMRDYAECGVDFISVGALTHQIKSLDMSLKACE